MLRLRTRWQVDSTDVDTRLLPLLRMVAKVGSLNRAVPALQLSYRHAWGMLGNMERLLRQRLVLMERGRGARLSAFAEKLLEADRSADSLLEGEMSAALLALNRHAPASGRTSRSSLVIHASHDLALAELRDLLSRRGNAAVDLHFRGSLECLASLGRAECELAGFHLPDTEADSAAYDPYRRLLRIRSLRLIRFVDRKQGLIVAPGNPKRLRSLADLVQKEVRFVNRQPESGTRLCFDRLLAAARIRPEQISGYPVEEFTHAAVAATIASGMADAGFGIEAAASRQGLDFVPLATERYYLAARTATFSRPELQALLEEMRGRAFLARLEPLPGYSANGIGEIVSVREALRGS